MVWILVILCAGTALAQMPTVNDNGVLNAASFATPGTPGNAVAPGSLVSIFGTNFASAVQVADSIPLSTTLANVSVTFNGIPAPLHFVAQAQVNAQLPWDVLPEGVDTGTATIIVSSGGNPSPPKTIQVARFSPGIFSIPSTGVGPGFVFHSDFSFAQPAGSVPGFAAKPAKRGEVIIFYANGLGPVDHPVANGGIPATGVLSNNTVKPQVLIGGIQASVVFAGLTPQFVGVNQVNVQVPPNAPIGAAIPIQLVQNGITSTDKVTIAIGE